MGLIMKHKEIPLTQGKVVLVDIEDYNYLMQWKWCADKANEYGLFYASRKILKENKQTTLRMHIEIMKPSKGKEVDHINGNGLDNRRSNLRICTRSQNMMNSSHHRDNASGYKGVHWYKQTKKWQARIMKDYKQKHLGYFNTKQEAAIAYNETAKQYHGEFAKLNNIKGII